MNLDELKAQHPELYAAVMKLGEASGVTKERDRAGAHLIMGEASGDMKTAMTAVKDGTEMTATLQATYMSAGMNRKDINARGGDELNADAGDGAGAEDEEAQSLKASANILDFAAGRCGIKLEA